MNTTPLPWIPIGERLPEDSGLFPVWGLDNSTGEMGYVPAYFTVRKRCFVTEFGHYPIYCVTHWLEITGPKEEK